MNCRRCTYLGAYDKYYIRLKDDGEFSITSSPFIMQLQNIYKLIDN